MTIGMIGAPTSAAGHWPGMEKAPGFLRLTGLPDLLRESKEPFVDHGDLPQTRWRADLVNPRAQNLLQVRAYLEEISRRVQALVDEGEFLLLVGGDCTVTVGAVAGLLRRYEDVGLMYLDGHIDLNTPASSTSGILDSMGMAHMFGHDGTTPELAELGPRTPMMSADRVVYFGHNERKMNSIEVEQLKLLEAAGTRAFPISLLENSATPLAEEALAMLEGQVEHFLLHFDVDVIRFKDFPIANVPIHNEGLSFDQAMECLRTFLGSPKCIGLAVTEINPDHANEILGARFSAGVAEALQLRVQQGVPS